MTTVGLMSQARPATYMVDDDVAITLYNTAVTVGKAKGEASSKYVNRLIKWALANYKEDDNAVRDNVEKQVPNS